MWVDEVYIPRAIEAGISEESIPGARYEALAEYDNGQNMASSFVGSAVRGVANTAASAVQGAGALTGIDTLEDLGTDAAAAVNDSVTVNPSRENTNFAGSVAGNVGAMLATGGIGGAVGKMAGAAGTGAEIGALGTGFLAGAGSGAQEADQYGITGSDRYLRALAGGTAEVVSEKIPFLGGMGSELKAISRIPGLGSVSPAAAGGFLKSVGSEAVEEGFSQIAGNAATSLLAPAGTETPGLLNDVPQSMLGGALGGGLMGGLGAINSDQVAQKAATSAAMAGDTAAAAVIEEANATRTSRMAPIVEPEILPLPETEDTTFNEPALQDFDMEAFAQANPVLPEPSPEDFQSQLEMTADAIPVDETTDAVVEPMAEDAIISPLPVPGVSGASLSEPEPPTPRQAELTAIAEQVLPDPQLTPEEEDAFNREATSLIETQGRIPEQEAERMFTALQQLGVTSAKLQINDTGDVPGSFTNLNMAGSRRMVDGQDTVFLNRKLVRADTPLHEVVHGLVPEMRTTMPELYAQGAQLIQGSRLMQAVELRYARAGVKLNPEDLVTETLATLVGNEGAQMLRRYAGSGATMRAIQEWLAKARVWLEDFLASKGVDPNMTLEQFARRVNRRIYAGKLRESGQTTTPAATTTQTPAPVPFRDSLMAELPEKARAAWTEDDLAAADAYAAGDTTAVQSLTPIKQKRVREAFENLNAQDGQSFSLASKPVYSLSAPMKLSGVSANQPDSYVRELVADITYKGETGQQAYEQARRIYADGQKAGDNFSDHLSRLNGLVNDRGSNLNMTPGAYFGLMLKDLRDMGLDESITPVERAVMDNNMKQLMKVWAATASSGGQFIKGFDVGLKIANYAKALADKYTDLSPFQNSQARRDSFEEERNAVEPVLGEFTTEALVAAPEADVEAKITAGISDAIKGESSAIEGEIALDDAAAPQIAAVEASAEITESEQFLRAARSVGEDLEADVNDLLVWLSALDLLNREEGVYSLSGDQDTLASRAARKLEELRASGLTGSKLRERVTQETVRARNKLKGKKPVRLKKNITSTDDVKGMVVGRLQDTLERLISPASKKTKNLNQKIAAAITNGLLSKSGLGHIPGGDADSMVTALGMLLANQETAATAVQDIHTLLQLNPETKDSLSIPKLKAFMQLAIGKEFSTPQGTALASNPYGERQIAAVLRAELRRNGQVLDKIVRDAATLRTSSAALEAQLRSPDRGFARILDATTLDKVVSAVMTEFNRTAKQRMTRIQARQKEMDDRAETRTAVQEAKRESINGRREQLRIEEKALAQEAREAAKETRKEIREAKQESISRRRAALRIAESQLAKETREAENEVKAAMEVQRREIEKDVRFRAEMLRRARRDARRKGLGFPPLTKEEQRELARQPNDRIIDYLAREFGFDISAVTAIARQGDRVKSLENMTLKLADAMGMTPEQAQNFMKPVVAEAMRTVDARRRAEVAKRISNVIREKTGRKTPPTEAQRLIRLAELGGLSAENVEDVMLATKGAKRFTPEFRAWLEDMIDKSNDPNLPQAARDAHTASYLAAISSARGISALGLLGEYIMANIFGSLNTFKVNGVWGFAKSFADSAAYIARLDPLNQNKDAQLSMKERKLLVKQMIRGYTADLNYQAKYIFNTGYSKLESDFTTQFSNSDFELLARFPDTEIRLFMDGKPLSPAWAGSAKLLSKFAKYVRRTMVATDIVNRTPAYEMLKANAVIKVMKEKNVVVGKDIDDALYGGSFEAAKDDARRQVDAEISDGKVQPAERGVRFGEILDGKLGANLGTDVNGNQVVLSDSERTLIIQEAQERAKRWTVANATEGILGVISNKLVEMVRDVPGLKFLLPAIRMPIGAFYQTLDWSPYGFARSWAIKGNQGRSSSATNWLFNRDGTRKSWNLPAAGVSDEDAIVLRNKAAFGTAMMLTMILAAAADWDEDDDKADFYITGRGPENPQKNKVWREAGNRPFSFRYKGVSFNYQESPAYGALAVIGAYSDAHRYGKPGDKESDRLMYAMMKSVSGFADAAVLKSFQDVLGTISGNGFSTSSAAEKAGATVGRIASVAILPRVGSEINTILYGPQDVKGDWGARILANVPFTPAFVGKPALNWFGEEIHDQRGGVSGEILPMLAHRISPMRTDDPQMTFLARIGANPVSSARRFKDGQRVADDYDFMRQWQTESGKEIRRWLTPDRMAKFDAQYDKDKVAAEKDFDDEVTKIRTNVLKQIAKGRIEFK